MLEQTSREFRAIFLLKLTREILENTASYRGLRVKEFIKEEKEGKMPSPQFNILDEETKREIKKEEVKEFIRGKIKEESEKISEMEKVGLAPELRMVSEPFHRPIQKHMIRKIPPLLRISEPALPETVSYLRPIPTAEEIDIGKLNILVKDPLVKIMECNGPEENILVMGIMGRKPTPIKLNREEVEEVVGKFAAASRIPVNEGLFKAAAGNLVISAVVSEIAGIKFIIRKISAGF